MTNKIDKGFNKAKEEIAGPGQKPTAPQPTPKRVEPKINCESIFLIFGISELKANNGLLFRNI